VCKYTYDFSCMALAAWLFVVLFSVAVPFGRPWNFWTASFFTAYIPCAAVVCWIIIFIPREVGFGVRRLGEKAPSLLSLETATPSRLVAESWEPDMNACCDRRCENSAVTDDECFRSEREGPTLPVKVVRRRSNFADIFPIYSSGGFFYSTLESRDVFAWRSSLASSKQKHTRSACWRGGRGGTPCKSQPPPQSVGKQ